MEKALKDKSKKDRDFEKDEKTLLCNKFTVKNKNIKKRNLKVKNFIIFLLKL